MKRIITTIVCICILLSVLLINPLNAFAVEQTEFQTLNNFINDPRFTEGVSQSGGNSPILSSWRCWGCCAYCADYVKFCYGIDCPSDGIEFYDTSEIRAGDVLTVGNPDNGYGHWFVCLKRSGNSLYVAEGNWCGQVRIGWNYTIADSCSFTDSVYPYFNTGYHYMASATGDSLRLGTFEQDNDLENGSEAIEWEVLDVQGGKALVVSKYALDCKPYNSKWTNVTWEQSSIRSWLNSEFIDAAFSSEDQSKIISSVIVNPDNAYNDTEGGNDTTDRVFLLSLDEMVKYYGVKEKQQENYIWTPEKNTTCQPTAYAVSENCSVCDNGNCWWLLRSPGTYQDNVSVVSVDGEVGYNGSIVGNGRCGVRPAMWINI